MVEGGCIYVVGVILSDVSVRFHEFQVGGFQGTQNIIGVGHPL